jgi:transcriptional regulator with XRE-family HTH domain
MSKELDIRLAAEQRAVLDARVAMAKEIRRQREAQNLTQRQLAQRINTTQPRVAKIEAGAPDVTLDQMYKALVHLGGRIVIHPPKVLVRAAKKAVYTLPERARRLFSKGRGKPAPKTEGKTEGKTAAKKQTANV